MALLAGSAAIGMGTAVSGVTTDQRGLTRGSVVDIGAFQTSLVVESNSGTVVTTAAGLTLPGAISLANQFAGSAITFDPKVFATLQTITLTTQLELSNTKDSTTITGPAAGVTISGGTSSRIFEIDSNVTASLSGLTITGGSVTGGGGVFNLGTATLANCTVSGNSATYGGGLANQGTATLTECSVSGNSAGSDGGGLENEGKLYLTDSALCGDSAVYYGGGLKNGDGMATLTNVTVSGNSAKSAGGIYLGGTAILNDCTVSGNAGTSTSTGSVGGIYISGTATLNNTIVAGNTNPAGASDIGGPGTVSGSNNLIGTGGSGGLSNGPNGNIVLTSLTNLGLAPLANNGGPTQTMALLAGSAAIGMGTAVSGVTTDQRGLTRGSVVDIGAFQSSLVVESSSGTVVTTTAGLTLPGAVSLANQFAGSAITFDPKVFATLQTITLTAQLELSNTKDSTTITGPAAGVTISGADTSRVFEVDSNVTASLSGLTITGGSVTGGGGGVFNLGTVTLTNCTVSGNSAGSGGGLYNPARRL